MSNLDWLEDIEFPARIVLFRYAPDIEEPIVCADGVVLHSATQYLERAAMYRALERNGFVPYYHDLVPLPEVNDAMATVSQFLSTPEGKKYTGEPVRYRAMAVNGKLTLVPVDELEAT